MLVVVDVVNRQGAAFAVLEPLVANLVAADMELPNLARHAPEILCLIDPHLTGSVRHL